VVQVVCGNELSCEWAMMKQKTADLAREKNIVDWEPSEEWLHRFKNRQGLAFN